MSFKNIKDFDTFINESKQHNAEALLERSKLQQEYAEYFLSVLSLHGKTSLGSMSDEEKKEFFKDLKSGWDKGKGLTEKGKKMKEEANA